MNPHDDATPAVGSLDAVIAAYLQAIEAGEVPNRKNWLDRHPELADNLRPFFADLDRMDRVAAPLLTNDETADDSGTRATTPTRVRYIVSVR